MTYEFVDNGITKDVVGQDAGRYTPFLGSLFLCILFMNFWAVIPFIQFPPTSRIAIPLSSRCMVYVIYRSPGSCTRAQVPHRPPLPAGRADGAVLPRDADRVRAARSWCGRFSLAVRLLANMMAGHILLTALALLTAYALENAPIIVASGRSCSTSASPASRSSSAFLQAYIFTLLTAVYIGDSLHPEH